MGKITLDEIIRGPGGGCSGKNVKFVIPGGTSTRVLTADELNVALDYDSLRKAGTSLGTGAVIVADESISALDAACNAADFLCPRPVEYVFPAKKGTGRYIIY